MNRLTSNALNPAATHKLAWVCRSACQVSPWG
jgi:hypothetical protein